MKEQEFNFADLEDAEREEMARQIEEGCTSGRVDDGEGTYVYWELKYNKWTQ